MLIRPILTSVTRSIWFPFKIYHNHVTWIIVMFPRGNLACEELCNIWSAITALIQMTEIRANFGLSKVWHTWDGGRVARQSDWFLMRSTIAWNAELVTSTRFHLISAVDVCNLAGWSYCSGLEAGTSLHSPLDGEPAGGYVPRIHIHAASEVH